MLLGFVSLPRINLGCAYHVEVVLCVLHDSIGGGVLPWEDNRVTLWGTLAPLLLGGSCVCVCVRGGRGGEGEKT